MNNAFEFLPAVVPVTSETLDYRWSKNSGKALLSRYLTIFDQIDIL